MRKTALLAIPLLLAVTPALAQSTSGNAGLALAALVALDSPLVAAHDKRIMSYMLNSFLQFTYPTHKTIVIRADAILCRASNVEITAHSCELTYGNRKHTLKGRAGHELYATLIQVGIRGSGAVGSMFAGLENLSCTVDPNAVKERDGSGADCTFTPG